jgi:drug/metabolite transporter (DMT)-like permease
MPSHNPLLGIALIVAAVVLFPVKDSFAKLVGGVYSPALIIWAQFAFMSLVLLPAVLYQEGWRGLWPNFMGLQVARGVAVVTGVGLFYWAITFIPLADATAVSFVTPLLVTAFSPVFLGEHVGVRRWAAVVFGFAGVIIVLRPDLGGARVGYVIALGTGVCLSIFYMFNRKLAAAAPPIVGVFFSGAIGAVLLTPAIPFLWVAPRPGDGAVIAAFLIFATLGQTFMVLAFKYANASVIAPFQYCAIVTSTIMGYVLFGDFPDAWTMSGIAVIIASGVYIAVREGRLDKSRRLSTA